MDLIDFQQENLGIGIDLNRFFVDLNLGRVY